jgi:hypothetical protein
VDPGHADGQVGEPPGYYARASTCGDTCIGPTDRYAGWYWDESLIRVWFDSEGRVSDTIFHANPNRTSTLSRWRARLGL